MEYFLKHRDDTITLCDFDKNGRLVQWAERIAEPDLAPLAFRTYNDWLSRWWDNRKIPLHQGRIASMLAERGIIDSGEYLLNNLGLSLTDHYWICPAGHTLKWKDVNLFGNDFKEDLISGSFLSDGWANKSFTPNSSLKGELEKTWVIRNRKRKLIKGNRSSLSSESINEVIATELHKSLGFENHTKYSLIHIKDKPYDFGCISDAFTSGSLELLSAYDLITSAQRKGKDVYEHLIDTAAAYGADRDAVRAQLEYQILTDYILSNVDRHMENIGFLRDTNTLKIVSMAPIFDTGRSLFAGSIVAAVPEEFENIETNSFKNTETGLLSLVTDRKRIDTSKLLSPELVEEFYRKDTKIPDYRIKAVKAAYETKIRMYERFRNNKRP